MGRCSPSRPVCRLQAGGGEPGPAPGAAPATQTPHSSQRTPHRPSTHCQVKRTLITTRGLVKAWLLTRCWRQRTLCTGRGSAAPRCPGQGRSRRTGGPPTTAARPPCGSPASSVQSLCRMVTKTPNEISRLLRCSLCVDWRAGRAGRRSLRCRTGRRGRRVRQSTRRGWAAPPWGSASQYNC